MQSHLPLFGEFSREYPSGEELIDLGFIVLTNRKLHVFFFFFIVMETNFFSVTPNSLIGRAFFKIMGNVVVHQ